MPSQPLPHSRRTATRQIEMPDDRVPPKFDAHWTLGIAKLGRGARPNESRPDEQITLSENGGRLLDFASRHTIIDEADPARSSYIVVLGSVMVAKMLPDGRRQILELLGPGDVFGMTSTDLHESSVETITPCRVIAFDRRAMQNSAPLQLLFAERMKSQFCALHDHAMLLGRKGALERVSTFIMRLLPGRGGEGCVGPNSDATKLEAHSSDTAHVSISLTRQEIADYLGLTLETVSRAFSQLKREGLLSYGRNEDVVISNVCELCRKTGAH